MKHQEIQIVNNVSVGCSIDNKTNKIRPYKITLGNIKYTGQKRQVSREYNHFRIETQFVPDVLLSQFENQETL